MKEINTSDKIDAGGGWKQRVLPGYEEEVTSLLNAQKRRELDKFFTNPSGRVTAIKPHPRDMTAAVLTARLSRAGERDVTELFWKEFQKKFGEEVGDRILNEFGDDSVREDASAYVFVRDVSVLTSLQIFRHPLLTGIEASTRYIDWGELTPDEFAVKPENVMNDPEAKNLYNEGVQISHETYKTLWPVVSKYIADINPKAEGQSESAYRRAVKGATCDALRGLLILGTKTNFGLHANYRTFSEIVMDGRASDFDETTVVSDEIAGELKKVNPVFMKVADTSHGEEWTGYRRKVNSILNEFGKTYGTHEETSDGKLRVSVDILNQDWMADVLKEAIVARNGGHISKEEADIESDVLPYAGIEKLLHDIGEARTNRRHKVPEILNVMVLRVKIDNLSFGAFKDLNRHRALLFKSEPDWSGTHGWVIPEIIEQIGGRTKKDYSRAQEKLLELSHRLSVKFPEESKLLLTHGAKTSVEMVMGGSEDYWITEIRSIPSGNPEYRQIAVEDFKNLIYEAPVLRNLGSFVDENTYTLGRIGEALRQDLKGK